MGSSKDVEKKSKKEKKEAGLKKEKKRSETDGISKEKKDKKKEKAKQEKIAKLVDDQILNEAATAAVAEPVDATVDPEDIITKAENLVPFAIPLADDKIHKKIYKAIKKGAKLKAIHRGVKECEKAIKKSPLKKASSSSTDVPGLVIIAGDISPMDVIMHFPMLCEEHGVPYLYVKSRADLGVAACTKRATSVVMLKSEGKKPAAGKKADEEMDEDKKVSPEEYLEAWKELVKTAQKQWTAQVEPWVKGVHPIQIAAATAGR
ncbi:L30e-like protein [Rhypophila decipiens]|uniref:L30e-like protein n=1 Tax=Rhypophila decipiens TaxID=261697 RepID=A0AAN6YKF7_9PEZI|nr:L30e-like protein [Rhypophila decipiens]